MSELLKITNVTKKYHHFKALNNVSMTLESGKIIGLLGPNGSGKTTLIKIINGLLKDYEGEVLVDGKNVGIDSRKIISYLPDENYFQDWMYIKDVLSIFSDLYEDFATVLNQVDILLLTDVYAAGEAPIPGADSRSLCRTIRQRGKLDPIWVSDVENISSILAGVLTDNDLVLVQGAGNIGKIARRLAETKLQPSLSED